METLLPTGKEEQSFSSSQSHVKSLTNYYDLNSDPLWLKYLGRELKNENNTHNLKWNLYSIESYVDISHDSGYSHLYLISITLSLSKHCIHNNAQCIV